MNYRIAQYFRAEVQGPYGFVAIQDKEGNAMEFSTAQEASDEMTRRIECGTPRNKGDVKLDAKKVA